MTFTHALFYLFGGILLFAAAMVVTIRHPVKSALFLVLAFFSAACLWVMMEAEFLGIALVLVYVGAVMVLFLFVVMMLDVDLAKMREGFGEYLPMGGIVAVLLVLEMVIVLSSDMFSPQNMPVPLEHAADYSNTHALGMLIYTAYVYPFEIAAVILLVAIVAAITLTLRARRKHIKYQNPSEQIKVRREDRVRLVQMKSEKRS
ncbi:MAG: NADH-quinone oxidoreductase subunit J [Acidiferrobacterales bacterium]|jgi:NADH-quinone oxidoreductase subunit J|nr:NADH-quinone oxidoreductase subunit J [Acidiferrobacterales bacterium]